jgi:L-asparaginase
MSESAKSCVAVFGLGGTIAMTQAPGGGVSPARSAPEPLAAVPGLDGIEAELRTVDFRRKPGASVSFGDLFELAAAINGALDGGCRGVVVTQGILLHLLIGSGADDTQIRETFAAACE